MGDKFIVIDLETTGNSPKKGDRIIQIGAVIIEDGKICGNYTSLVNPERPIPVFIEELTGIKDDMVKDAPVFKEIASDIIQLLDDSFFVAHNVLFDLGFLQEELQNAGYEGFYGSVLDTVELSRILFPTADGYKLSDLAAKEGINHDRPHQADSDAYVTAELLLIMLEKIHSFPLVTLKNLTKLSASLKSDIYLLFDEIVNIKAQSFEKQSESLDIHRGIALKKNGQTELEWNLHNEPLGYPFQMEEKEQLLKRGYSTVERRLGQMEMMDDVYHAFVNQQHCLIEAGTGIGKTLGYLVPAVFYSKLNHKRVVISTFTTQLQQQLLFNDLPKLSAMIDFPIKASVLKGKSHYINLARFEKSLLTEEDNYDTTLTKMQILVWLLETTTGDVDELNLSSGGQVYWDKIKNVPVRFSQMKEWDFYDFYIRACQASKNADLIITNHSMLLTDHVAENPFIPEYEYVVLDEAHHFERTAGKSFGKKFNYVSIRVLLNQLAQIVQGQFFQKIEKLVSNTNKNVLLKCSINQLNQLIHDLQFEMDQLFMSLISYARKLNKNRSVNRIQMVLHNDTVDSRNIFGSAERFIFLAYDICLGFEGRMAEVEKHRDRLSPEEENTLDEIVVLIKEMEQVRKNAREMFLIRRNDEILWIETDLRSVQNMTTVYARPPYVSERLKKEFFAKKKSVVMTSATLTVQGAFDFIKSVLGLQGMDVIEKQIPSPFRYEDQVRLIVPDDLPDIKSVSDTEYTIAITEHIISIAEATKGRMLTLFTSHEMLKKTYELIKESELLDDFVLIAQGITTGSRGRLIRNFQRFEKAILFGTSSFWEGIDIPGEDLSCLIIVRLPFSSPEEPLFSTKRELILKQGGNPFYELSLPEAVLRFKQGFGRLVRSSNDRGVIFVFDRRIVSATYGSSFLNSIPNLPVKKASIQEIVSFLNKWL
ncbi:ATP-dependent DNA helicase DinG [Bacillus sp. B15-48]|uniref:ATP-dependent DNA helicase DinG n=1 Tax=Bacillus sp. B15-48 TaxID=1548601 RepID=UPI00193EEDCC|nr:ATP-dependent DNA helicase DinG [Bacillus sp. B15-48]MBM4762096.1 ATP-dependent DNA helicase DinG [Bacillus sp. B15-48]